MKMEVRNKRLTDEEFFKQRKEVLAMWPKGKELDLNEAIGFHKNLAPGKNHALEASESKREWRHQFQQYDGDSPS